MRDDRAIVDGNVSLGGKIGATLFAALFAAAGLVFVVLIGRQALSIAREHRWTPTPCTIIHSALANHASSYRFEVRYRYSWQGHIYTSTTYQTAYRGDSDAANVQRLIARYPAGSAATCLVNPVLPTTAILAPRSYGIVPFALIPLLILLFSGAGIRLIWRDRPAGKRSLQASPTSAAWIVGGAFTLAGLAVFGAGFGPSAAEWWSARSWPATPCVIESSRVQTHTDSDGATYSIDILYRYQFAGRWYHSSQYDFSIGSSSGYDSKERVVRAYPHGRRTVCYVNPADPFTAVLSRDLSTTNWFLAAFGVLFAAVGIVVLIAAWRSGHARGTVTGLTARGADGGQPIRAGAGPITKLLAILAFCAFWNGIVSIFLYQMIEGWRGGHGEIVLTLFLIPFELIGLGLIAAAGYFFLALFNPRPHLTLGNAGLSPGASTTLDWTFSRRPDRVRDFTIELIGQESATVSERRARENRSNESVKHIFFRQMLIDATDARQIADGRTNLAIPANMMHSFSGKMSKIAWLLRTNGKIPHWPAIRQDFVLTVLPPPADGRAGGLATSADATSIAQSAGPLRIGLPAGRTRFVPGETIDIVLAWNLDAPAQSIRARLCWYTTGRCQPAEASMAEKIFDSPASNDHATWRLTLPAGPWSFSGRFIELRWAIELTAKPGKRSVRTDLIIAPGGETIHLEADAPEPAASSAGISK